MAPPSLAVAPPLNGSLGGLCDNGVYVFLAEMSREKREKNYYQNLVEIKIKSNLGVYLLYIKVEFSMLIQLKLCECFKPTNM